MERDQLPPVRVVEFSGRQPKIRPARPSKSRSPAARLPPKSFHSQSRSPDARSRRSSKAWEVGAPPSATRPSRSSSRGAPGTQNDSNTDPTDPSYRKRSVEFRPPLQPASATPSASAMEYKGALIPPAISATPLTALGHDQNRRSTSTANADIEAEESAGGLERGDLPRNDR